jgi:pimeloyl-ACP methyl ester carboxylesterase
MHLQASPPMFSVTDVHLHVSDAVPVTEPCSISCSLFVPADLPNRPVVLVAIPGGTYSRAYFDLDPPGHAGHSQARYFAERGVVFAAMDYLGGGDSSRPADGDALTLPVLADASHAALLELRAGLLAGAYSAPALVDPIFVGLGFSFGGGVMVVQQGTYADFDAMAICGFSPLAADAHEGHELPADWEELSEAARRDHVRAANTVIAGGELPVYHGVSRFSQVWRAHYLPDTDEDLIAYDDEQIQTLVSRNAGIDVMTHGFTRPFAEQVTSPVLIAFGDRDIVATPQEQPRAYTSSQHITLTVIPDTAHLANFLPNRAILWDRTLAWLNGLAALVPIESGGSK